MKYFAPIIFPSKVQVLEQFLCRWSVALFFLIYGLTLGLDHLVPPIISYLPTLMPDTTRTQTQPNLTPPGLTRLNRLNQNQPGLTKYPSGLHLTQPDSTRLNQT